MGDKVVVDSSFLEGLVKITTDCLEYQYTYNLLLLAIEKNVEYLVDALLPFVKDKCQFHEAAILSAVLSNSTTMMDKILNDGATVNTKWNKFGETSLHSAAELGHDKMVAFLIGKGADVNCRDKKDMTPLHFAKSAAVVEVLLGGGADVNAIDVLGNSPLRASIDYPGDDYKEFSETTQDEVIEALLLGGAKQDESPFRAYSEDADKIWIHRLPHPGRLVSEYLIKCKIAKVATVDNIEPWEEYGTVVLRSSCEEEVQKLASVKLGTVSLLDVLQGNFKFQDLPVLPEGVLKMYLDSDSFEKQFPNYFKHIRNSFEICKKKVKKLLASNNLQVMINLSHSNKKKLLRALPVDVLTSLECEKRD